VIETTPVIGPAAVGVAVMLSVHAAPAARGALQPVTVRPAVALTITVTEPAVLALVTVSMAGAVVLPTSTGVRFTVVGLAWRPPGGGGSPASGLDVAPLPPEPLASPDFVALEQANATAKERTRKASLKLHLQI
jgi:hypothetical protein